ncbi:MAG: hypothetical protein WCO06_05760, partial [Candidatus Roizmanbacteria bacterium]
LIPMSSPLSFKPVLLGYITFFPLSLIPAIRIFGAYFFLIEPHVFEFDLLYISCFFILVESLIFCIVNYLKYKQKLFLRIEMISYLIIGIVVIYFSILIPFYGFQRYIRQSDNSFRTLSSPHETAQIINPKNKLNKPFYKGDILYGEFVASINNVGQIYIPFTSYTGHKNKSYHKEKIYYRIKEKSKKSWLVEGNLLVLGGLLQEGFIPLGFPVQSLSKNKRYQFEITTDVTPGGDYFVINSLKPSYSKYITSQTFYKNPQELFIWLEYKFKHTFLRAEFVGMQLFTVIIIYAFIFISVIYNTHKQKSQAHTLRLWQDK